MEDKKEDKGVFELIDGLATVDPNDLDDFKETMKKKVIPTIVKIVEKRRLGAAKSRHWQLKC